MKNSSRTWIEIAKQVSTNPFVKISCPDCKDEYLQILIIPWKGTEAKVDIHLICESCGVRNTVTKAVEEAAVAGG